MSTLESQSLNNKYDSQCNETAIKKYINAGLILNLVLAIIYSLILIIFGHQLIGFLNLNNLDVEKDAYLFLVWS